MCLASGQGLPLMDRLRIPELNLRHGNFKIWIVANFSLVVRFLERPPAAMLLVGR
jgi:hypothetical protein